VTRNPVRRKVPAALARRAPVAEPVSTGIHPYRGLVGGIEALLEHARRFYETETLRAGWSVRRLDRQIQSQFYERTALSRNKAAMLRKVARGIRDAVVDAGCGDRVGAPRRSKLLQQVAIYGK